LNEKNWQQVTNEAFPTNADKRPSSRAYIFVLDGELSKERTGWAKRIDREEAAEIQQQGEGGGISGAREKAV
jgi:hypothetical protein